MFAWRDRVGREEDESVHYVLSKPALRSLALHMPVNVEQLMVRLFPAGEFDYLLQRLWCRVC